MPRPISDHYPICIEANGIQWGPVLFRLDSIWLKKAEFHNLVKSAWKNYEIKGCASYRFVHKLKAVKKIIKQRTKTERVQSQTSFDSILSLIAEMDFKATAVELNEEERDR